MTAVEAVNDVSEDSHGKDACAHILDRPCRVNVMDDGITLEKYLVI